jgi:hypothetical protein
MYAALKELLRRALDPDLKVGVFSARLMFEGAVTDALNALKKAEGKS